MKVSLTSTDFQEALVEFQQQTGANHQHSDFGDTLTLPKKFGEGRVGNENLREGLDLLINEHLLNESFMLSFTDAPPDAFPIVLKFFLSGFVSGSIQGIKADHLCIVGGALPDLLS